MNRINLQLDAKSVVIGFLLAVVAVLLFSGFPSRANQSRETHMIAADENGVYVMRDGFVRYIEKRKCIQKPGCHYFSE
jgi:hypothetical protein